MVLHCFLLAYGIPSLLEPSQLTLSPNSAKGGQAKAKKKRNMECGDLYGPDMTNRAEVKKTPIQMLENTNWSPQLTIHLPPLALWGAPDIGGRKFRQQLLGNNFFFLRN